jgi:hypothetical protein
VPRAPGKWKPYQEARHLVLTYRLFAAVIRGERALTLRVTPERSRALYEAVLPNVLAGGTMPSGGRAPIEAEPEDIGDGTTHARTEREEILSELDGAGREFHAALESAGRADPQQRIGHHLFGLLTLVEWAALSAAHTRHHLQFLPAVDSRDAG